jgi:hypothetical protein
MPERLPMTTSVVPVSRPSTPINITTHRFQIFTEPPSELEWFANLTKANPRLAYRRNFKDFQTFEGLRQWEAFRDITRARVVAWRQQRTHQSLTNGAVRRNPAAPLLALCVSVRAACHVA